MRVTLRVRVGRRMRRLHVRLRVRLLSVLGRQRRHRSMLHEAPPRGRLGARTVLHEAPPRGGGRVQAGQPAPPRSQV